MSKAKVQQEEHLKALLKSLKERSDELIEMKEKIDDELDRIERQRLALIRTFE